MHLKIDKTNWTPVSFGDVVAERRKSTKDPVADGLQHIVGLEHIDAESIHLRRSEPITADTTFSKTFKKGDVLFGRRRAYLKKAAQAPFSGICSGDITVMYAKEDLLPELLPFLVNNDKFFDFAVEHSAGGLSPRVKFRDLANYQFLLPPKAEQARLAELLWAGDGVLEGLERVKIYNQNLLKSQYKSLFDYGYNSRSKKIPKTWRKMKIKTFAEVKAGSTPLRSNKSFFDDGSINWVKTLDLNNGKITCSEELINQKAIDETSCKVRPKGTVLLAMYGGFNQIGRTGILEIPAATNQAISGIEVDKSLVEPRYLLHVLNGNISYWKKVAISSRKDPNITKSDVENFPVPIPDSLHEQTARVKVIDMHLGAIEKSDNTLSSTRTLQKSLINQIF